MKHLAIILIILLISACAQLPFEQAESQGEVSSAPQTTRDEATLFLAENWCASLYNFLTQRANAPILSKLDDCVVEELLQSKTPGLDAYRIAVDVADPTDSVYDLIFFVNGPGISVYELETKDNTFSDDRTVLVRRFVSSERSRTQRLRFDVYIDHKEQGTVPFKVGKLSKEECPLELHSIRRK